MALKTLQPFETAHLLQLYLLGLLLHFLSVADAIGCYKCSTSNNDTECIDPFNPGMSPISYYQENCLTGMDGRVGLFPARYCLKVSGVIANTNQQIVIRTCTVNKLLDSDTSYSSFTLQNGGLNVQVVSGLIASCKDDGCNAASPNVFMKRGATATAVLRAIAGFLLALLVDGLFWR